MQTRTKTEPWNVFAANRAGRTYNCQKANTSLQATAARRRPSPLTPQQKDVHSETLVTGKGQGGWGMKPRQCSVTSNRAGRDGTSIDWRCVRKSELHVHVQTQRPARSRPSQNECLPHRVKKKPSSFTGAGRQLYISTLYLRSRRKLLCRSLLPSSCISSVPRRIKVLHLPVHLREAMSSGAVRSPGFSSQTFN